MNYKNNNIHADSLQIGLEFQDYVVEKLLKELGIPVTLYGSKKYQFGIGENIQGIEIKYDARSTGDTTHYDNKATNNIAIEVAEKANKDNVRWISSGIYRNDNTWLYIIGNYMQFWIFGKSTLQLMHKSGRYKIIQILPTSQTMLIPVSDADNYCLKKIVGNSEVSYAEKLINGPNR